MPVVHPAEIWKEQRPLLQDRPGAASGSRTAAERDMVLAMTHEEVVALLLRDIVQSYRQLPMIVYHFQTKFRDEPRSRGGPDPRPRVRHEGLVQLRPRRGRARRELSPPVRGVRAGSSSGSGLDAIAVGADVGIMGGTEAHEFMVLNAFGEDTLVLCDDLRLRREPADRRRRQARAGSRGAPADGGRRDARRDDDRRPGDASWASGRSRTAKAAFFMTGDGRLRRRHRPRRLRRQRDEARQRGQGGRRPAPGARRGDHGRGHGGGLRLADRCARRGRRRRRPRRPARRTSSPARTGVGWHVRNVNVAARLHARLRGRHHERPRRRPVPALRLAGAARARASRSATSSSSGPTSRVAGRDVPRRGRRAPSRSSWARTASASGRNVACIVEAHHDEKGIVWPAEVAPYPAHLVAIGTAKDPRVTEVAERLHDVAKAAGSRDPVRRPGRVARREVHRRRAARACRRS